MTFVVSAGQLARVSRQSRSSLPLSTVSLSDRVSLEYAEIWRRQPQVRTVVGFLARNIAQLGLHVYRRVSDLDRERVTDHPLAQLLAHPNPHTTTYRFIQAVVSDMGIYDNAIIAKVRPSGSSSRALVRVDPRRVTLQGENPYVPDGFEIRGPREKIVLRPDQVIHFRGYSPLDERWGTSPMETLRSILAEEYQAQLYRQQLWRNGARASGYLERPTTAPDWSRPEKERFRAMWQAQYAGDGSLAGGTPILEDGMRYVAASTSPKDAQYIESRKLTREEVAAAFHIPLPLVGILDHATFSNIREQHKHLYQDCLGPWLEMIQQELELQLVREFPENTGLYVEFNVHEKLRGSFEEQAIQLQTAVGGPWMTRNEARARMNLPQIDDGDDLITPMNVLTGGQASPRDSAPPAVAPPQTNTEPKNARYLRAVEGD